MIKSIKYGLFGLVFVMNFSCQSNQKKAEIAETEEKTEKKVVFSQRQVAALGIRLDTIPYKTLTGTIEANGVLEVPPQNEAAVTAVIGANIAQIDVIEGNKVSKGETLAWLHHPDLFELQTAYLESWNQMKYLEQQYLRQKKLYEAEVGSGREFQQIQADYGALQAKVKGLESRLKLLGILVPKLQEGKWYEKVPVKSPIEGYIKTVAVKTGQYVSASDLMFEVVNIDHIHADLMVFESDILKVKEGQKVRFTVQNSPHEEMMAEIYAVGKSFEQQPKAVHIHAEIENKQGWLIPGMYVRGRVLVEETLHMAMPEEAIVREGEKYYLFSATSMEGNSTGGWTFTPVEIRTGTIDNGWAEVRLMDDHQPSNLFAMNQAYYIHAEMNKGEGGHH